MPADELRLPPSVVRDRRSMMRLRFTFRLRTLLVLVTLLSLLLGAWAAYRNVRLLAAQHHYSALAAGYRAVRIQKPESDEWNSLWRRNWKWPSPLRMDREAIEAALPLWRSSVRHAQLRDHYLRVIQRPWLLLRPCPPNRRPQSCQPKIVCWSVGGRLSSRST